jgi:hypothetical protein
MFYMKLVFTPLEVADIWEGKRYEEGCHTLTWCRSSWSCICSCWSCDGVDATEVEEPELEAPVTAAAAAAAADL